MLTPNTRTQKIPIKLQANIQPDFHKQQVDVQTPTASSLPFKRQRIYVKDKPALIMS